MSGSLSCDPMATPSDCRFAGGYFVGDYEGLTSDGTDVLAYFSASHTGDPASAFFSRLTP